VSQSNAILELKHIGKQFGAFEAVKNVSFEVRQGEFFTLVGPSGSGKTTLLRMLVGMEFPTSGNILLNGEVINDVPANKRPTCMVFQSLALFPHMTVAQNIQFPMRTKGVSQTEWRTLTCMLMEMLHLPESYYSKKVTALSGGERQRVALARALAYEPEILFFDEPLSAIDARLRKILQKELKDIQRKTGKAFVYVTHSLEEAMIMSDRLAILRDGNIEQIGTPTGVYEKPRNAFVAEFIGEVNLLEVVGNGSKSGQWKPRWTKYSVMLPEVLEDGVSRSLMVRPETLHLIEQTGDYDNHVRGRLVNEYMLGSRYQYHVDVDGHLLTVERKTKFETSQPEVYVGWSVKDSMILEA
jgi:spermidine/putrescine transport system ATP-binding protein